VPTTFIKNGKELFARNLLYRSNPGRKMFRKAAEEIEIVICHNA
jgi:hypothetical protein